jgi:hypothetical protein
MFRGDFEFHDGAAPRTWAQRRMPAAAPPRRRRLPTAAPSAASADWPPCHRRRQQPQAIVVTGLGAEAEKELQKIPFFVRGKARRNTERFARDKGVPVITVETSLRCQSPFQPLNRSCHPLRVVLVTMDSHLASAAERANRSWRAVPGLTLTVHAAAEWRDDAALQRCIADIARGDIVIVSMLFMEDHFLPVLPALQARREHCDAMVCLMSAAEVMSSRAWASST